MFQPVRKVLILCIAGVLVGAGIVVLADPPSVEAANKVEICHRTRSVTNPYRRISVSSGALNSGHKQHTGDVFDAAVTYGPSEKWGDIIPDGTAGGSSSTQVNFTGNATGQAIWNGTDAGSLCKRMTPFEFLTVEVAGRKSLEDLTDAQALTAALGELDDMAANDDAALLAEIGSFASLDGRSLEELESDFRAVNVETGQPSASGSTLQFTGLIDPGSSATITSGFEYSSSADCSAATSVVATPATVTSSPTAISASVNSVAEGTWYVRAVGVTAVGTADEGRIEGDCRQVLVDSSLASQTLVATATPSTVQNGATSIITVTGHEDSESLTYSLRGGDPCTIADNVVTVAANSGTCVVTVSAPGDATYNAASTTVTITAIPVPAEDTPAEETPAEETPAEETPAEETPAEESSTTTSAPAATAGGGGPSGRPSGQQQIVEKLTLSSKKEQEPNTGTLEIGSSPSGPGVELQSATTDTSGYEIEIVSTGTDYNKPETWVAEGFGEICWKIEDFTDDDYVFVLDDVPSPPDGIDGVDYEWSAVKVKAGSIRSTDPDFQVNTMFMAPVGGTAVFADSNKSGTSDPGGGSGDKSISHIIFCVNPVSTGSGTTTSTPTTVAPTTAAPTTAAPTTAAPTTAAPTTAAPTTAAPTTAAPTTATPTTVPLPRPPVVIRLKPVVAPTTTASDTTATPTTATPTTATPTTAAPTTAAPTTAAPTTTAAGGSTTPTTSTAPADGSSTTASPVTTAVPATDAPSEVAEVRMILSTGNETVKISVKVRPASFEVLNSPVPQVSLPATGSSSPVWPGVLLLGLGVAVIGVRRRVF
jgi:hypothetical protein